MHQWGLPFLRLKGLAESTMQAGEAAKETTAFYAVQDVELYFSTRPKT